MQKLTLKSCIQHAIDLEIPIYGDVDDRELCNVEDSDLASFFAWVRYQYPQYSDLIFHPENEFNPKTKGSYAYYAKSKAKGRLDSIADVICLPVSAGAPAFVCELKRKDISKSIATRERKEHFLAQLSVLSSQKSAGNFVTVALGLDAIKKAFIDYLEEYA